MTLAELKEKKENLRTEILSLHENAGDEPLKDDDAKRFNELSNDYKKVGEQITEEEGRRSFIETIADESIRNGNGSDPSKNGDDGSNGSGGDSIRTEPPNGFNVPNVNTRTKEDIWNLDSLRSATPSELKARAKTAIEKAVELPQRSAESATAMLRRDNRQGLLARHIIATGSEAYRTGFQQLMAAGPENAAYDMNEAEKSAIQAARALSLTAAAGGFAVPFTLDPTIISTKDVGTNPIRLLASQRSIVTDQWNGLTSAGVTAGYAAEAAEVGDNSPTLAQPSINVHRAHAFVAGSIEITQDWPGIEEDLSSMFNEARDDLEANKFLLGAGDGSNEPQGIVTGLDGTSSEIAPETAEAFALDDVVLLPGNVIPKYRRSDLSGRINNTDSAVYLGNLSTYLHIKQLAAAETGAGYEGMWLDLGGGVQPRLNGYPAYESSDMKSATAIDAGATADNFVLLFGNVNRGYRIIDRVGMMVEYIPHLFATANNRPSGQRGWYAFWRNGAEVIVPAALALLSIPTAA